MARKKGERAREPVSFVLVVQDYCTTGYTQGEPKEVRKSTELNNLYSKLMELGICGDDMQVTRQPAIGRFLDSKDFSNVPIFSVIPGNKYGLPSVQIRGDKGSCVAMHVNDPIIQYLEEHRASFAKTDK